MNSSLILVVFCTIKELVIIVQMIEMFSNDGTIFFVWPFFPIAAFFVGKEAAKTWQRNKVLSGITWILFLFLICL